jgi:hypothetical protein
MKKRGEVGGWKKLEAEPSDAVEMTPRDLSGRIYTRRVFDLRMIFLFQISGTWAGVTQRARGGLRVGLGGFGDVLDEA